MGRWDVEGEKKRILRNKLEFERNLIGASYVDQNNFVLEGIVEGPAEVKTYKSGTEFVTLKVKQSQKRKMPNGDQITEDNIFSVSPWGQAATVAKTLRDGMKVVCFGKLTINKWTDKQSGEERTKLNLLAFSLLPVASNQTSQSHNYEDVPF